MDDLDRLLDGLARAPGHPGLEAMEARVMARLPEMRAGGEVPRGALAVVARVALAVGVVSGQWSAARAAPAPFALDAGIALAPSSRLAAGR